MHVNVYSERSFKEPQEKVITLKHDTHRFEKLFKVSTLNMSEQPVLHSRKNRNVKTPGWGAGGVPLGSQILTLFQTTTCNFPYTFSDLTSKIHTRFQISYTSLQRPKLCHHRLGQNANNRFDKIQL